MFNSGYLFILISQIGPVKVNRVLRHGGDAVHITDNEVKEGEEYKCVIDWSRRFDHMQQHSGS